MMNTAKVPQLDIFRLKIFRNVKQCILIDAYQHSRAICWFHLQVIRIVLLGYYLLTYSMEQSPSSEANQ